MTQPQFTLDQLADAIAARLREPEKTIFSLAEVAEMTGWSLRWLGEECKAGRLEFVYINNKQQGMTRTQIDAAIAAHTQPIRQAPERTAARTEADALARTREHSARRHRGTRRTSAKQEAA